MRLAGFLLMVTLLSAGARAADPTHAEGVRPEIVRLGVEMQYFAPYYRTEQGEYLGFARELFDAFAADSGLTIHYYPLPVKRLQQKLLSGDVDARFPDNPKWAPELRTGKEVRYSASVVDVVEGLSVLPSQLGNGIERVRILGTILGFTPWPYAQEIAAGHIEVIGSPTLVALVDQMRAGRVDAIYLARDVVAETLRRTPGLEGAILFDKGLPSSVSSFSLSSFKRPDLIARFDDWMRVNPDKVMRLKDKFGLQQDSANVP